MISDRHTRERRQGGGFTFVEVLAVLVVMGILAAIAFSRYSSGNASAVAEAEIFKSCLRYAQVRAMGDISTWGIEVAANGTSYTLVTDNTTVNPILPGVGGATRTLPTGVTATASAKVYFDSRGQPVSTRLAEYQKNGTWPTLQTTSLTISFSGSPSVSVAITPYTGFAQ